MKQYGIAVLKEDYRGKDHVPGFHKVWRKGECVHFRYYCDDPLVFIETDTVSLGGVPVVKLDIIEDAPPFEQQQREAEAHRRQQLEAMAQTLRDAGWAVEPPR